MKTTISRIRANIASNLWWSRLNAGFVYRRHNASAADGPWCSNQGEDRRVANLLLRPVVRLTIHRLGTARLSGEVELMKRV